MLLTEKRWRCWSISSRQHIVSPFRNSTDLILKIASVVFFDLSVTQSSYWYSHWMSLAKDDLRRVWQCVTYCFCTRHKITLCLVVLKWQIKKLTMLCYWHQTNSICTCFSPCDRDCIQFLSSIPSTRWCILLHQLNSLHSILQITCIYTEF